MVTVASEGSLGANNDVGYLIDLGNSYGSGPRLGTTEINGVVEKKVWRPFSAYLSIMYNHTKRVQLGYLLHYWTCTTMVAPDNCISAY